MPVAFAAWGYSSKSSGGFQTVGALKGYELIEDEGSGEDRVIQLTPSAREYFLTELPEDQSRLRSRFAQAPKLFSFLLDYWDGGVPDSAVARTYLKTQIELSDQSARSALGVFKDNLEFIDAAKASEAGSTASHSVSEGAGVETDGPRNSNDGDDAVVKRDQTPDRTGEHQTHQILSSSISGVDPGADRDIFSVTEGEVVLVSPKTLSDESWQDISDWLDIMKRKLGRKVQMPEG